MNIGIILAGGTGSRMSMDTPKQYVIVNEKPIFLYSVERFLECALIDEIIIGAAEEWKQFIMAYVEKLCTKKRILFSKPGMTRQYSVLNALQIVYETNHSDDDIVIIHDAARPLVSEDLILRCIQSCSHYDCVLPVIPSKDTIYKSCDGKHIESLLCRDQLWNGQAPEAFRFGKYYNAHKQLSDTEIMKINGSTELAYKTGLECIMIEGDVFNFKITTQEDLSNFKSIINKQQL